jgi:hypothetical protein
MKSTVRRDFLKQAGFMGSAAVIAALPQGALAFGGANTIATEEALQAPAEPVAKNRIKFAVCGMSHDHIYGMIGAVTRGGGEFVAAWASEPDKLATLKLRFPNVKVVATQDEIIDDPTGPQLTGRQ